MISLGLGFMLKELKLKKQNGIDPFKKKDEDEPLELNPQTESPRRLDTPPLKLKRSESSGNQDCKISSN